MGLVFAVVLILGGILALSNIIVAKKPEARDIIEKLVPYKAFIGVAMLALALILLIQVGPINVFRLIKVLPFFGFVALGSIFSGLVLGFMFGAPQIATWTGQPQQKVAELNAKLAPFQFIIGIVAAASGFLYLLIELGIMKPTF